MKVPALRIVQVHGAGEARVKGVDRANDLDRLFEVGHRRANQRLLQTKSAAVLASRGEPFHVVGTTSW